MNVTISIHYKKNDVKVVQRGTFPVDYRRFKENEQLEVTNVAKGFLSDIKKEMGKIDIEKVTYNEKYDITSALIPFI
ncbi:hypothetical protein [Fervidibacillus halotolerans]|uniref:Uncharacterized protein n=1 Tax=Fervidibacillus halotolerans TaxID=2980027 RepID=A0A9E8M328_9BACI|nr:hypothetical protein [Fervidibacillus halotolerans]WAA13509.1 hypothetical protein OE105_05210 [Fervidibacillus halotolerans]